MSNTPVLSGDEPKSEEFTLRVKCKKSQNIKYEVNPALSMPAFLKGLSNVTGVPADQMGLRTGFPPKRIYYTELMSVRESGIRNGDTIIVEVDTSGEYPGGNRSMIEEVAAAASAEVKVLVSAKSPQKPVVSETVGAGAGVAPNSPAAGAEIVPKSPAAVAEAAPKSPAAGAEVAPKSPAVDRNLDSGAGPSSIPMTEIATDLPVSSTSDGARAQKVWNDPIDVGSLERTAAADELEVFPTGIILRKTVPSDNSCMFSSVQYSITGYLDEDYNGRVSADASKPLREVIAKAVKADPTKYSDAFLGRSNADYTKWIQKLESWGGAIELSILSQFYEVEINVMDTQHDRMNRFGEDKDYKKRVFLIYDGIHYDPLYMESYDGTTITTTFSSADTAAYEQVMELGREARASHQFTDLQNFTLMCSVCKTKFVGQKDAQAHAEQTRHTEFEETM